MILDRRAFILKPATSKNKFLRLLMIEHGLRSTFWIRGATNMRPNVPFVGGGEGVQCSKEDKLILAVILHVTTSTRGPHGWAPGEKF